MPHADFVHLRTHSAFSLSEGAIKVPQLVDLAAKHQMPAIAITDKGNLFGEMEFSDSAIKSGIQPIIGIELAVSEKNRNSINFRNG